MFNVGFVIVLAVGVLTLITWGVRNLPRERWQMIAAVPLVKSEDGSWRGLNLTYYGFFSATGTTFGALMFLLLLASLGLSIAFSVLAVLFLLTICVPASRLVASIVEHKRNTFTVAGASFVATIILPLGLVAAASVAHRMGYHAIPALPALAAGVISYVLGESIGRLACLSFGCCYGVPIRDVSPTVMRLLRGRSTVIEGRTKKASYASGLSGEPLVPVQAVTSAVFALAGVIGTSLFVAQRYRLAALVPLFASCGWRALSEHLRADYRGSSRISKYQVMALISMAYVSAVVLLLPGTDITGPDIEGALHQMYSPVILLITQLLWVGLFLYYGMSRVTASKLTFHVVREQV